MRSRLLLATALLTMMAGNVFAAGVSDGGFDGKTLKDWNFSQPANKVLSAASNTGILDTILTPAGTISQAFKLAVGNYTLGFDSFGIGSGSSISVSLGSNKLGSLISGVTFDASKINGHQTINFSVAKAGTYKLVFSGQALGSILAVAGIDNVAVNSAVAVPGPEAGAGLGALAMAGAAVWVRRRRAPAKA